METRKKRPGAVESSTCINLKAPSEIKQDFRREGQARVVIILKFDIVQTDPQRVNGLKAVLSEFPEGMAMTEIGSEDTLANSSRRSIARIGGLMVVVAIMLGWLATRAEILFADGLRYIAQAQALNLGKASDGLKKAVDHPVYPIAIVAVHRLLGGENPEDWQTAAQGAAIVAGVLLVIPLYLNSREIFGESAALPATLLFYAVPVTGHVFADTLSESTFLFFWAWGLWASLRFLKSGQIGWIPLVVVSSALAYLTRPEGLLLPAALVVALILSPKWVARGLGRRGLIALGVLVLGSAAVVGPYVALKGGLGTKPSIARLLGTAPRSAPGAVERERPPKEGQTEVMTYILAGKAVGKAVSEAVSWPLVPFWGLGILVFGLTSRDGLARQWRLLTVIGLASLLALIRLHATGGYCSPRHAMILSFIAIPTAAAALNWLLAQAARLVNDRVPVRSFGWVALLLGLCLFHAEEILAPLNQGMDGYRQAGHWLAAHSAEGSRVVDVTGWSQFYGQRLGYTFANLIEAQGDPKARWVVAREAHLKGPWEYCQRLRDLVNDRPPIAVFRGSVGQRPTKIYLFDRQPELARQESTPRH